MNEKPFPNPEGKINVLKRYLHILALLQYTPEDNNAESWNAGKLANLISKEDTGKDIDDSQVRKYIKEHIENELDIDIDKARGLQSMSIAEDLDIDTQLKIARVYADFVVKDATRDIVLKKFIEAMPDRALWTLARIYFAVVEKRMIQINYTNNSGYKINKWKLCPYYFMFRNDNLYLAAWDPAQELNFTLLAERIKNLVVLDKSQSREWSITPVEELYKDSISAYISIDGPVKMKIRYAKTSSAPIESIISPLDPEIKHGEKENWLEAEFVIDDYLYLCKQFVFYGKNVEIISPPEVRKAMIKMLKVSLSVYE
jgi:predicted DNA-binding transcriptional regulator YafY